MKAKDLLRALEDSKNLAQKHSLSDDETMLSRMFDSGRTVAYSAAYSLVLGYFISNGISLK